MVKVITCITSEAVLLPHFARYYQSLGVDSFVIAIEEGMQGVRQRALEIAATLDAHIELVSASATRLLTGAVGACGEKMAGAHVAPADWVIPAELDEFIEFPAPIPALIEEMAASDSTYLVGKICDRIAPGGALAATLEEPSIWAQYPLACRFPEAPHQWKSRKVALCRGDCELTPAHHHVIRPSRPLVARGCVVHRFKWRQGVLESIERARELQRQAGLEADPESENAIAYLKANGRIIPGDFGAVQGWRPDPPKIAAETIVYTAISKGYDLLREPEVEAGSGTAFVAFTQDPQASRIWQIRSLHAGFEDPCRNAKIHKVLPHLFFPDAAYSLWVDGSVAFRLKIPVQEWITTYLAKHDLAVFAHPLRNCIYAEADTCILDWKDDPETIREQMRKYRYEGYPRSAGLAENTVLLRRHTEKMKRFDEVWWEEISRHSRRDQLSFNYVAWKLGFEYSTLPGCVDQNEFFDRKPHLPQGAAAARDRAHGSGATAPGQPRAWSAAEEAKLLRIELSATKLENKRLRQALHASTLKEENKEAAKVQRAPGPFRKLERTMRMRRKRLMKALTGAFALLFPKGS